VGRSQVANGCHRTVPELPVDNSSAQDVLDGPVC